MTTLKKDSNGRTYVDYTNGQSFYKFEIAHQRKLVSHIIFHIIHTYGFVRAFSNLDWFTFSGPDIANNIASYIGVGLLIVTPILYWGLSYRNYKKLQKGISI